MDQILSGLQTYFPSIIEHKYLLLLLGATFESLSTLVLAGFLYSIGAVSFWPAVLICLLGEFLNGVMWYSVGYFGGSRALNRFQKNSKSKKIIEVVERYFHKYSGRAIIITKLTWSLTIATMIMAGVFKYSFKKMSIYNVIGSAGWLAITFSVGYVFGESYKAFEYLNNFMAITLTLVLALVFVYLFKLFFKSAFLKSLFIREKIKNMGDRIRNSLDDFMP